MRVMSVTSLVRLSPLTKSCTQPCGICPRCTSTLYTMYRYMYSTILYRVYMYCTCTLYVEISVSSCTVPWIKKTMSTVTVRWKNIAKIPVDIVKSKTFQNIWVPQFAVQGLLDQCLLLKSAKVRWARWTSKGMSHSAFNLASQCSQQSDHECNGHDSGESSIDDRDRDVENVGVEPCVMNHYQDSMAKTSMLRVRFLTT